MSNSEPYISSYSPVQLVLYFLKPLMGPSINSKSHPQQKFRNSSHRVLKLLSCHEFTLGTMGQVHTLATTYSK